MSQKSRPLRLANLDPQRTAEDVVRAVHARAFRDARALGLVLRVEPLPQGMDQKTAKSQALDKSKASKVARTCADWAIAGRGTPEEVTAALRELRALVEGVDPGQPMAREPRNLNLTPATEVLVVAAEARLALVEGRTIDVGDVATLAGLDERSIRAAVAAGWLQPVGPGRPMRFAARTVCDFLYVRGVAGFAAPAEATPAEPTAPGATPEAPAPAGGSGATLSPDTNPWEGVTVDDPLPSVEDAARWTTRQIHGYAAHLRTLRMGGDADCTLVESWVNRVLERRAQSPEISPQQG